MRLDKSKAKANACAILGKNSYACLIMGYLICMLPTDSGDWAGEARECLPMLKIDVRRMAREMRCKEKEAMDLFEGKALEIILKSERK